MAGWLARHRPAARDAGAASARFGLAPDGRPSTCALAWEERRERAADDGTVRAFHTRVPHDYAYFAGHFPSYPVLAGVVQLHELVLPCLRRARPDLGALTELAGLKFLERIAPGDTVEVVLRFAPRSSRVEFEILRDGDRAAVGRLAFAGAVPVATGATAAREEAASRVAFRACVVVPTFDNPRTVRAAVETVRAHVPDVILVDDGSGAEGRAACDAIEAEGLAILRRHDKNAGKGAAVKTGLQAAAALGFTHVLQVDADGQHDLARIPAFLQAAAARPDALVLGYPEYDVSAPLNRLLARHITHFWVGIELGRRDRIVDALIGFRVYPVAAALAARTRGDRMDFDVEIAVRMARAGAPVINLPVGVRYPSRGEGGISHFQPWRDNLRFCRMHTRLCVDGFFGRLRRGGAAERRRS